MKSVLKIGLTTLMILILSSCGGGSGGSSKKTENIAKWHKEVKVVQSSKKLYYPKVVKDDNGNTLIAWNQNISNSNSKIEAKTLTQHDLSNNTQTIVGSINKEKSDFLLSVNRKNNDAVIAWADNKKLYAKVRENGVWGNPTSSNINNEDVVIGKYESSLIMNKNSEALLAFNTKKVENSENKYKAWAMLYRNGLWSNLAIINTDLNRTNSFLTASFNNNTQAAVAITQKDVNANNKYKVYVKLYNNGWKNLKIVDDETIKDKYSCCPKVIMNDKLDIATGWAVMEGFLDIKAIMYNRYLENSWQGPKQVNMQVDDISAINLDKYKNDGIVIVYAKKDNNQTNIYQKIYINDSWIDEEKISTVNNSNYIYKMDVKSNEKGDIFIVFSYYKNNSFTVYSLVYNHNTKKYTNLTKIGDNIQDYDFAINSNGKGIIVYVKNQNNKSELYEREFY